MKKNYQFIESLRALNKKPDISAALNYKLTTCIDGTIEKLMMSGLVQAYALKPKSTKEWLLMAIDYATEKATGNENFLKQLKEYKTLADSDDWNQSNLHKIVDDFNEITAIHDVHFHGLVCVDEMVIDDAAKELMAFLKANTLRVGFPGRDYLVLFMTGGDVGEFDYYFKCVDDGIKLIIKSMVLSEFAVKPMMYEIMLLMLDGEYTRALGLCKGLVYLMMTNESLYISSKEAPKKLGARGGRKLNPRKSELMGFAERLWNDNPTLSLEAVSESSYLEIKNKYNDHPSLKTVKGWLRVAEFRPGTNR